MNRTLWTLPLAALLAAAPMTPAHAAPDAVTIIKRAVDNQVFNLKAAEMKMAMFLRNKQGDRRERRMQSITRQVSGLNKTVTRFISRRPTWRAPRSSSSRTRAATMTSTCTCRRSTIVRRIVGSQKDASFMGSDFSYADLESRDHDEATHKLRRCQEGRARLPATWSSRSPRTRPTPSWSPGSARRTTSSCASSTSTRRARLLKVFFTKEIKQVGDQKVLSRFKLANKQTGHSTVIAVTDIKIRTDLGDDTFTKRALKKR